MRTRSVHVRLTVWYTLALAATLLLFAGAVWLSMWRSLRNGMADAMAEQMRSIESFLGDQLNEGEVDLPQELREYAHAFPSGMFAEVRAPSGERLLASAPDFPWGAAQTVRELRWHGQRYNVLSGQFAQRGGTWHATLAVSHASMDATLRRLGWLLAALTPLAVLLAPLGGAWLSRRALKPVDEITTAARQIGIQNLSERLPVPHTEDELERLADTWNGMLARLEDAVLRLSRFTTDASHELRTPLAVIRATAEIAVRRTRTPEAYRAALEEIVSESERMTVLIEDLLFLARCDADSIHLPQAPLSIQNTVEDVSLLMRPIAEARGVRLLTDLPRTDARIIGNESAIRRLVTILLDNAVKYCRPGGTACVAVDAYDGHVYVSVQDQGPGICDADLPFVFQRFFRGSEARENGHAGFGLGLALAAGIAEQHRSAISVRSSAEGSVFTVDFPGAA